MLCLQGIKTDEYDIIILIVVRGVRNALRFSLRVKIFLSRASCKPYAGNERNEINQEKESSE